MQIGYSQKEREGNRNRMTETPPKQLVRVKKKTTKKTQKTL
jgi:hypothetical protein